MRLRRQKTPVVLALVLGAAVLGTPQSGRAQDAPANSVADSTHGSRGWFPSQAPFERLLAFPREVQFRAALVFADRDVEPDFEGRNLEGVVALGQSVGLYRFDENDGIDGAVSLHLEFGIFTRFFMEQSTRDLINLDFRLAFPIQYRTGPWQLRVGYRHSSSHVGDDYLNFFPDSITQTSEDGIVGDLAYRVNDELRVYGGGDYNFYINPEISRGTIRGGIEFDAVVAGEEDAFWPFLAAGAEYFSHSRDVGVTVTGGIGLRVNGRLMRIEGVGQFGPTPMGQFREVYESLFGLGIKIDL